MAENKPSDRQQSGLREKELELLRSMFEKAPVFIGITEGPDHRLSYINEAFRKLLGGRSFTPGIPASKLLPDIKTEDEQEVRSSLERLNQIYATGEPLIVNEFKTLLDRTGKGILEKGFFNFVYQPLKDDKGEVYGLFLAGYEVTDHVKARQEKVHSEKRLQLALEGAQVGFWEAGLEEGSANFMSRQGKEHFGFSPDYEPTPEDIMEAIHPDDRSKVEQKYKHAIETGQLFEDEYRVVWPDGSVHWLEGRGHCLYDEEDQPYHLIGVTIDISERKQAERKLMEAVRLRDDFLAVASHELQTPVTSLKIQSELLERQLRDAGHREQAKQAGNISRQIEQLSRLTGRLLDGSRMQQNGLVLEIESFSLGELIKEKAEALRHISRHVIEVQGEMPGQVQADRSRIGQVLTNLIENAIKYSPEGDRVVVRLGKESGKAVVSVIDFGIGIPKEERMNVFERFFKGGGDNKQTYPGFGIGLYISRQIIKRHGGGIWVEDNPQGGSVFSFSLPVGAP